MAMRFIPLLVALVAACSQSRSEALLHPSDQRLHTRFVSRRAEFDQLLRIFRENHQIHELAEEGFRRRFEGRDLPAKADIPEPYRSNYRNVLARLGVRRVVRRADGNIIFIASEDTPSFGGSAKGYNYSERQLGPEVKSLDAVDLGCHGAIYYAALDGGWSLYLQSYCS
jgi:hypothetical protein